MSFNQQRRLITQRNLLLPHDVFIRHKFLLETDCRCVPVGKGGVSHLVVNPNGKTVIGGGRIGFRLAKSLEEKSIYCKIIEKNAERCSELAEKLNNAIVLHGDGSDQSLLNEENVGKIDVVAALTNDEETNIIASLLAKRMGAPKTITRVTKFSYFPLMSMIGLEQVVIEATIACLRRLRRMPEGVAAPAIACYRDDTIESIVRCAGSKHGYV